MSEERNDVSSSELSGEPDLENPIEVQASSARSWIDIFDWQIPFSILLLTLLVTNVIQLSILLDQAKKLNAGKVQFDQALPRADMVRVKLDALARDLVELAKTNPDAHQIQDDMKIQIADPPAASPAVAAPTP